MKNRLLLEQMWATGQIHLNRSALFDTTPPPVRLDPKKIEGMLLGLAIGDALGNPTEGPGWNVQRRSLLYRGQIDNYFNHHRRPDPVYGRGYPSDDTQLSFWTVEQLLKDGRFDPENLARLFVERGTEIVGMGRVMRTFLARAGQGTLPWDQWAVSEEASGNGALMRMAPLLLPHLKEPSANLWVDVALAGRLTHNDSGSLASCLALSHLLWQCLGRQTVPPPEWWPEEFVRLAAPLETMRYRPRPHTMGLGDFEGTVCELVRTHVLAAYEAEVPLVDACGAQGWNSGAYVPETIPSLLYLLMKHGDNFEECLVRAVNDTHDNDTLASLAGTVLGALHGVEAIPPQWIKNLSGRTRFEDNGQVFRLIAQAKTAWFGG